MPAVLGGGERVDCRLGRARDQVSPPRHLHLAGRLYQTGELLVVPGLLLAEPLQLQRHLHRLLRRKPVRIPFIISLPFRAVYLIA